MKIAIFEDNDIDYMALVKRIDNFFENKDVPYSTVRYFNPEDIYNNIYDIDLIFLDIENNSEVNGIDIGIKIKDMKDDILIIFISNYSQYLIDGYKAHANRYLFKSMSQLEFNTELNAVLKKFLFRFSGLYDPKLCLNKIYFKDIIYIEFLARKSNIHFQNGSILRTNYQLKEWMEKLPHQYFGQIFRSIIVNYTYVSGIKDNDIILSNNEKIPLSKKFKDKFMLLFTAN